MISPWHPWPLGKSAPAGPGSPIETPSSVTRPTASAGDDVFELVEIELTTKTLDRYLKIFGSHDERIRFDGVTSVLYVTDERTGQSISRQIEQRVHVDDRARFTVLPVLDGLGRLQDDLWPYTTPRFAQAAGGAEPAGHPDQGLLDHPGHRGPR